MLAMDIGSESTACDGTFDEFVHKRTNNGRPSDSASVHSQSGGDIAAVHHKKRADGLRTVTDGFTAMALQRKDQDDGKGRVLRKQFSVVDQNENINNKLDNSPGKDYEQTASTSDLPPSERSEGSGSEMAVAVDPDVDAGAQGRQKYV